VAFLLTKDARVAMVAGMRSAAGAFNKLIILLFAFLLLTFLWAKQ
jgi:hypothetical protein